ncbi:hypothetical protein B0T17DRAFT_614262 [Bombardia bombarda]|uniref:Secreted protein n=1 Tax=Bombardia bombarda TaxID=252184 RepID=A0AA40C7S4_9PEZI|nr:hypothetical protein B0T17DRAFT_614262 [Bombardia bombarda]
MKLVTSVLLLAASVTSVLGGVTNFAAVAGTHESIDEPYSDPGVIQCETFNPAHSRLANLIPIYEEGLKYLQTTKGNCDIGLGHHGCGRVSCSWNTGVYVCAHNVTEPINLPCPNVAYFVNSIINTCNVNGQYVKGAAWDQERRFWIEVHADEC